MFRYVVVVLLLALLSTGCSETKEDAVEAALEIRALCKDKKNDQANAKGIEMYEKNVVFKIGVDESAAVWKVKDIANYNYCGPAFVDGHRKISEADDPESCSCRVVGAQSGQNDPRRGMWLMLGAVGVALWRRRRR